MRKVQHYAQFPYDPEVLNQPFAVTLVFLGRFANHPYFAHAYMFGFVELVSVTVAVSKAARI